MSNKYRGVLGNHKMSESEIENALEMFYGMKLDEHQKRFRDALWDDSKRIVFCDACAGSGKTTISLGVANLLYQSGMYKGGIVYIISPTMEEKQGYLPGDSESKSAPYMEPLYQACLKLNINPMTSIISSDNTQAIKDGTAFIQAMPHTYLRGTNFEDQVVILDESQNYFRSEILKTLTRVHDSCKVVVIGHTGQVDLFKHPNNSGFEPMMDVFRNENDDRVAFCELVNNYRGWISRTADKLESEIKYSYEKSNT